MSTSHKNKTFATFLALAFGFMGAHRFYLKSGMDRLGIAHLASLTLPGLINVMMPGADWFFRLLPVFVSAIVGFLEALIIGLTSDEKFDAQFNPDSGRKSDSGWVLAVLLVTTMMVGTTGLIATMSRLFDLLYTGGAYG